MTTGNPLKRVPASGLGHYPAVDNVIQHFLSRRATPGGVLSVTHEGNVVMEAAFGNFTYDPASSTVSTETVYDIASLTKVLASTAMAMLLYDRGSLPLDSSVADVVPEFLEGNVRRKLVTFKMLLVHSSGLPGYARLFEQVGSRQELLQRCFSMPLKFDPGTHTEYSDIGFILLGEALERIAGEKLDAFCQREVFIPLNMSHACFCPTESMRASIPPTENDLRFRKRVIQGEVNDENAYVLGGVAGHAGLFSPASDIAKFAICILKDGAPLFQRSTIKLFTRREESPSGTSRALGWDTPSAPSQSGKYFSANSYGHLGFTGTSLWIDPEKDLSVTLLTNRTWPDRSSELIKEFRPALHDAVIESLKLI